ncbi:leucyl/phenylalanyl-tRNA--protein transferase [Thermonema rossianum]|uniref:leucyl/phenylalanyl-tRNA--protein transferase n=1 Tax=Thermonema rossianum TaxID=55505 RepID=UPI00056FC7F9|nr:leucyl/phenylalanyl-tRNA--protein transferase [Thermonema rossianum]
MAGIHFLGKALYFPPVEEASEEGIVAIGGDLSHERLLLAYRSGIFPWYNPGEPIIWWSPDPRFVLYPAKLKVSKSSRQILKKRIFEVTYDKDFVSVITHCQQVPRKGQHGTWITEEMKQAYIHMHRLGYAHSVEVWQAGQLVGGLYGLSMGRVFFGESMFSLVSNASKVGFITLCRTLEAEGFHLIDCQVYTQYLESLGAELIPRRQFIEELQTALAMPSITGNWGELFQKIS